MSDRIKYLEEKVLFVLEKHPKTRNDDALLTFTIIWEYSNKSIKEIADACGFENVTYFSQEFKKYFHLPPGKYRTKF